MATPEDVEHIYARWYSVHQYLDLHSVEEFTTFEQLEYFCSVILHGFQ